ncbi:SDR family NAD(P)-dependent oxidoreductase [Streptomyces sp. HSG2]|uniref:SDR family NAD(P)-dependent oxidoreductase n=1 Tax=Streptomyces sp. HSG2 TaxID=2797167 RepID=UPI0019055CB6|nr:SDR family NAD(P)-dependent oxidoreductase [Streptomyces sp. HSG2]
MAKIVLTGASSGIGAAAAVELTKRGQQVVAVGRSPEKLANVHRQMVLVAPSGLDVPEPIAADLTVMADVRHLAAVLLERCPRIDVLVNNAAAQPSRRVLTADGYELGLAVNHLAPYLMTRLLVDRLRDSAGRVVTTSSSTHVKGSFDFGDLQMERGWRSQLSYGRSKLANILFTSELHRRTQLPASSFHPGAISTDLNRNSPFVRLVKPFERFVLAPPEKGAETLVWLATDAEGAAPRGLYYADRGPVDPSPLARDGELAAQLWKVSADLVGLEP